MKIQIFTSLCSLLLFACSPDEPNPVALNGEFTIDGESYDLKVSRKISTGLPTGLRDIRLLFFSKPYPIEGEDVENLHMIGIDIMIMDEDFVGNYELTGDLGPSSMLFAYATTELTIRNSQYISGSFYEFKDGELSISKTGKGYHFEFNLTDSTNTVLIGHYEGIIE